MNPIMQMFRTPRVNNVDELIAGVRNGSIDPQAEVMKALNNMNSQQRMVLKQKLPILQRFIGSNNPVFQQVQAYL